MEYSTLLGLNMTLQGLGVPPQHTQYMAVIGEGQDSQKTSILKRGKGTGDDGQWPKGQHFLLVRNGE